MNLTKTTDAEKDWKGFTLDELRYQRAYSAAKSEISKERLLAAFGNMTSGEKKSGLIRTVMGSLNYFDYGLIAFRAGTKLFGMFKALKGLRRRR